MGVALALQALGTIVIADVQALKQSDDSPFMIIIDGGSTGSRLHVFEFVETPSENNSDREEPPELECVRRGSARANYPLSAFGRTHPDTDSPLNATKVAEHLLPTFVYAAEQVPVKYHASTPVYYQATAGMRLLEEREQDAVYDALYQGLIQSPDFKFHSIRRSNIATLSGEEEGFFGAVAANYLKGTIDAHMKMIPSRVPDHSILEGREHHHDTVKDFLEVSEAAAHLQDHHHGPIGALDMGGSSTQIVFLPGHLHHNQDRSDDRSCKAIVRDLENSDDLSSTTCHTAASDEIPSRLNGEDFFASSYLSYGVDQFRERLWTTWVTEHKAQVQVEQCCDGMILENPCTFKGYEIEWHGYTLVGTGDAHKCVEEVQRLIPHPEEPDHEECTLGSHVGGVQHPPVRGKFFAMSLYFFTLDSLRELSHPNKEAYEALNLSWPTPSINELYNALDGLCSRSWEGDLEDIQHNAHAFTRAEVLPHRCLESVYMVTLLRDGFGFAPESRDITFTFLVDESEVEWSLGMALALNAEEADVRRAALRGMDSDDSRSIPSRAPDEKEDRNATENRENAPTSTRLLDALSKHLFSQVS